MTDGFDFGNFFSNPVPGKPPLTYGLEIPIESPGAAQRPRARGFVTPRRPGAGRCAPSRGMGAASPQRRTSEGGRVGPSTSQNQTKPLPDVRAEPRPASSGVGPEPAPAKSGGALVVPHPPFSAPFPICDSPRIAPRTPSAGFVSYLRPATQTRHRDTTPKLDPLSGGHSIDTIPSCPDFAAAQIPYLRRDNPGTEEPEKSLNTIQCNANRRPPSPREGCRACPATPGAPARPW